MNLPRYIEIDLSSGKTRDYLISEENYQLYLGGKALAARILYDELQPGIDPLSPENIVIINTSPMTGTGAPSTSRFNLTTKNVLTGGIASSNCGGTFGMRLRKTGYDGVIIKGKASAPSYIEIRDGQVSIKDASHLWGMTTEETQRQFDKRFGLIAIGPAGENLVRFACAASGERVLGRCGVGAVLGSKNIKAVVAHGSKEIPVDQREALKAYTKKWIQLYQQNKATGELMPKYGSAGFVTQCNAAGVLPTRNFQAGRYEKADLISGETLAEKYLVKNAGCISCPIRCERRVMVNGKEVKGPEYETIGLLGSNLDNSDLGLINQWNYEADVLGMDTISLGGTLAFAMELQQRGMKDFGLRFGSTLEISEAIRKIAYREGELGELADGSKVLAEKYGGKDFAIHAKGLELASYEPRRAAGHGLGYATANRGGCHLNGGYMVFLEAIGPLPIDPITTKSKGALTVVMQNIMEAVSVSGFCLFSTLALAPDALYRANPSGGLVKTLGKMTLAFGPVIKRIGRMLPSLIPFNSMYVVAYSEPVQLVTGHKMTTGRFIQMGERSYNMERLFNLREGLGRPDDTLPDRLTKEPADPGNAETVVRLDRMLPEYYAARGWDENGVPTPKKLKQLGIVI
ncbi:MAG: aldehyde ferredoxin oxidoreductase family protein [Solirubrobacterales bacterium]